MKTTNDLVTELAITSEVFSRTLSDAAKGVYLQELSKYPIETICEGIRRCRIEMKSMPTISDILEKSGCSPENEDQKAMQVVGLIWEARRKFSIYRYEEAKAYVGELGWQAVRWFGGWNHFCENTKNDQDNTARAQMRELVKAASSAAKQGTLGQPIPLPEIKQNIEKIKQMYSVKQITKEHYDEN